MVNFSFLTLEAMIAISAGSVSFEQIPRDGGGVQYIVTYPNGDGASIIKLPYSFGYFEDLWEVALIEDGEMNFDERDPWGHLTEDEVVSLCAEIRNR